jgi:hypothetical protein
LLLRLDAFGHDFELEGSPNLNDACDQGAHATGVVADDIREE